MDIARIVARILLGLVFAAAGIFAFIPFTPPPMPGLAGEFQDAIFKSHYVMFTDGVQLIVGVLLVSNFYVPLALVVLAGVLANILVFHLTMQPQGIWPGLVCTLLWLFIAWPLRSHFAPLFVKKLPPPRS